MFGAIIGDIVGSIYEFDNVKTKGFPLFSERSHFTDDTVCTVAIAHAILRDKDFAKHLRLWGETYPEVGYGGKFASWLRKPETQPYNSFGNGSAMRVSPAALYAKSSEEAIELAYQASIVTHNHPEGIRGACATSLAINLALNGKSASEIRNAVHVIYGYDMTRSVDEIRPNYKFNETCMQTVPEALTCALEATDFEDAIRNAISIGGDSDTIGAIAGALAEALFGIPDPIIQECHKRIPYGMTEILENLYAKAGRLPNVIG
jgi:ADP-ribosylglycohydrolase